MQPPYFDDGISLKGDPVNPQTSTLINQSIDNYPLLGTVYTFVKGMSGPTLIDDIQLISLNLYPNPVSDFLNVNGNDIAGNNWNIVNSLGQIVMNGNILNNNISIQVNDLNNGYYLFQLISSDHRTVQKAFIK